MDRVVKVFKMTNFEASVLFFMTHKFSKNLKTPYFHNFLSLSPYILSTKPTDTRKKGFSNLPL